MPDYPTFEDELREASLDGIEFPVSDRQVRGGRTFGRRRFPYRDGQSTENTGREPYIFELTCPILNGVTWPHELWPATWDALRGALEDPERGGEFEYVDNEYGPLPCIVSEWTWETAAEPRNGGMLRLVIEERQLDTGVLRISPDADPTSLAETEADAFDAALEEAGVTDQELADAFEAAGVPLTDADGTIGAGATFATLIDDFAGAWEEGALATDELAAVLDQTRTRIEIVTTLAPAQSAAHWRLVLASERLIAAVTDIAERVQAQSPPIIDYVTRDEVSVYEVSTELYRTPNRAGDILSRNRIEAPLFIPKGTLLRVLAA